MTHAQTVAGYSDERLQSAISELMGNRKMTERLRAAKAELRRRIAGSKDTKQIK